MAIRGITLENILLDANKELVKFGDFGYSKSEDSLPRSGTPGYTGIYLINMASLYCSGALTLQPLVSGQFLDLMLFFLFSKLYAEHTAICLSASMTSVQLSALSCSDPYHLLKSPWEI